MAFGVWISLATFGLMLAFAVVLLAIGIGKRPNRAFAYLLVCRALAGICQEASTMVPPELGNALLRFGPYFMIALPFLTLHFMAVYPATARWMRWRGSWLVLALPLAVLEAAYLLDHDLWWIAAAQPSPNAGGYYGASGQPLFVFDVLHLVGYALLGLVFLARAAKVEPQPMRRSFLLVGVGFGVVAGYNAPNLLLIGGGSYTARPFPMSLEFQVALAAAGLLVLASVAVLLLHAGRLAGRPRRTHVAAALVLAGALASSMVGVVGPGIPLFTDLDFVLATSWRLVLPILVLYCLLRHHIFDIDIRVRRAIGRSVLAAAILASFFVAEQVVQSLLSKELGVLAGAVAAGLTLLAISPLERMGHRLAHAALPAAKDPADMRSRDREDLYREQANLMWADGAMDRQERTMMDGLRERLGIPLEVASRIEREAAASARPAARRL